MKLEEIHDLWEDDSQIDRTNLGEELSKIPQLHARYYRMFTAERMASRKLESDLKRLRLEKTEFYTMGHTAETKAAGWELPPKGSVLKSEAPVYVDADPDVCSLSLRCDLQREKVDLLESIIKSFIGRGYNLKAAVDYQRFINGA